MTRVIPLEGRRFERLVVIARDGAMYGNRIAYRCLCDCGKEIRVVGEALRDGRTKSCGCYTRGSIGERSTKHGLTKNRKHTESYRTYAAWCKAKSRCNNPTDAKFQQYGARGIKMCERWASDFRAFLADMGECPTRMTLERKDVNGNYEPGNCLWASMDDQRNNKQDTRWVRLDNGSRVSLKRFCLLEELPYKLIHSRLTREIFTEQLTADIVRKVGLAPLIQPRRGHRKFILR